MGQCFGYCFIRNATSSTSDDQVNNLISPADGIATNDYTIFRILRTKSKRHSTFIERFWERHRQNLPLYSRLNSMHHNATHCRATTSKPNQNSNSESVRSEDIQLHCLDASTLLTVHNNRSRREFDPIDDASVSSLANSSLDLEWEHERHNASWAILQEDFSSCSDDNGSISELSHRRPHSRMSLKRTTCQTIRSRSGSRQDILLSQRTRYGNSRRSKSNNSWSHISTPDSMEWDVHDDENKFKSEEDLLDHETMELLHEIEWLKNRALDETGEFFQCEQQREEQS